MRQFCFDENIVIIDTVATKRHILSKQKNDSNNFRAKSLKNYQLFTPILVHNFGLHDNLVIKQVFRTSVNAILEHDLNGSHMIINIAMIVATFIKPLPVNFRICHMIQVANFKGEISQNQS